MVIDLFSGRGGLLQALLDSGLGPIFGTKVFILMFEIDPRCRKLLVHHHSRAGVWLSQMADSEGVIGSAFAICERVDSLISFLKRFKSLKSILVAGGSPCVGFSIAKENRRGIQDPESNKLVVFPFLLSRLKAAFRDVNVVFMLENVSMDFSPADKAQRAAISQCLGVEPDCLKASLVLPAERERCFWTNLRVEPLTAVAVDAAAVLEPGWRPLWEFPSGGQASDLRFATFCRGFAQGSPHELLPEHKAFPRLSLHSYSRRGLVYKTSLSESQRQLLATKVAEGVDVSCSRRSLRRKGSDANIARGKLAKWIHTEQGSNLLRPLSGAERDRALGFPAGPSALPGDEGLIFCLDHMRVTGNTFAVPVVQHVLSGWCSFVLVQKPMVIKNGFPALASMEDIQVALTPPKMGGSARQPRALGLMGTVTGC